MSGSAGWQTFAAFVGGKVCVYGLHFLVACVQAPFVFGFMAMMGRFVRTCLCVRLPSALWTNSCFRWGPGHASVCEWPFWWWYFHGCFRLPHCGHPRVGDRVALAHGVIPLRFANPLSDVHPGSSSCSDYVNSEHILPVIAFRASLL